MQCTAYLLRGSVVLSLGLALATAAAANHDGKTKFCQVDYVNRSEQTTFGVSVELVAGDKFSYNYVQINQAKIGSSYGPKELKLGNPVVLELESKTSCEMETTISYGSDYHTSRVKATGDNHDVDCKKQSTNNFMKTYGCDCDHSGNGDHSAKLTITCTDGSG